MKRTVLTCVISIVACSTQARHIKQPHGISDPYLSAIHNGIVGKQLHATTAAKTTAAQYRYIASAYRNDNQLRDTTHFYYSGFRGSSHPTAFDYTDQYEVTVMDSRQRIKSDSSVAWTVSQNGTKNLYLHKQFVYDNDDRVILQKNTGTNYFVEHHATYEINGNLKHIIQRDTFGGSGLIDKFKHHYTYNSQNKVILDSLVSSVINTGMAKAAFTYDANGNMLTVDRYNLMGSTWHHNNHLEYTYDANNRIISYEYSYDNGSGMAPTTKYIYTYTGNAAQFTYQEYSYWDNNVNGWVPIESYQYTLNTAGYIDAFYIREYNELTTGWDTLELDRYTYHTDNRLDKLNGYLYQGGGVFDTDPYDEQKFYYETYYPAGVSTVENAPVFTLYPNPASNILTVQATGAVQCAVTGLTGRILQYHDLLNTQKIDVSTLPAGTYILTVQGIAGEPLGSKTFIKQ